MIDRLYRFRIAGHLLELQLPSLYDIEGLLPSFRPFFSLNKVGSRTGYPILKAEVISDRIEFDSSAKLLTEEFGALGHGSRLLESKDCYFLTIQYVKGGSTHQMRISHNFEISQVFIDRNDPLAGTALSFFLMFAYAQRAVYYGTLLLHASVVVKSGRGYAFMGKSGTGKSTHSALWLANIAEVTLLNDDNPAVRVCEQTGTVQISGTPWSGKTNCYKNTIVELGAMVRLFQASVNRFEWQNEFHGLLSVLPGCSSFRWDHEHYMRMCNVLESIVATTPVGVLECLPDSSAVELCYEQIKIKTGNEKM